MSDDEALLMMLAENIDRENVDPKERARVVAILLGRYDKENDALIPYENIEWTDNSGKPKPEFKDRKDRPFRRPYGLEYKPYTVSAVIHE